MNAQGINVTSTINDIDDTSDDDDSDFEPNEETVLESYTTPLDEENCEVDEYQTFKQIMAGNMAIVFIFILQAFYVITL